MKNPPLAALLALAALAPVAAAQNLLTNPGFESGLAGWGSFGPNIYIEANNPPAIVPHSGTNLCKMYGQFIGGFNDNGIFQSFAAQAGQTYQLDCWTRHFAFDALAGSGGPNDNVAVMKMAFFDAANSEIGSAERRVLDGSYPTNTWIDNPPVAGTAPPGTVRVDVLLLFIQPLVGVGSAHFDDVEFTLQAGGGTYPGSGEDLVLATGIGGAVATPGADVKVASGGSMLEFNVSSPGGTYSLSGFYLLGDLFPTGAPPVPPLPSIWLGIGTYFTLVDGSPRLFVGQPLIGPNGGTSTFVVAPNGFAGTSLMIQGIVISPSAQNGIYAATNAHEIRLQ
ncbi:MAG: hypothetical protein AB7O97_12700 [Planctomycetota bacterium]